MRLDKVDKVSHHVTIDSPAWTEEMKMSCFRARVRVFLSSLTFCPELDGAKSGSETWDIWDKSKDEIGDSTS